MDDPESLVRQVLASGARVQISGLQGRADLNGSTVKVLGVDKASGRWECELIAGPEQGQHVRCKPENLLITEGKGAAAEEPSDKGADVTDADKRLEELVKKGKGKRSRSRSRRRSRSKSKSKSKSRSRSGSGSGSRRSSSSSSSSGSRDRRRRRSPSRRRRSNNFASVQMKPKDDPKNKKQDKKRKKHRSAGAEAAAFLLGLK
mmetsp:Transcript_47987/g.115449  ORF Transcript_47987/g.115449 Transcript_47987/m.115449 type:complete len:203 (-) Transcript_47987:58-666(-)